MKKITLKTLTENSNIPAALIRATVKQFGGWESFTESAPDVTNHDISCGFSGFIYHTETLAFTRKNRALIAKLATSQAADFGTGVLEMVQCFGCLGTDYGLEEIGRCLYGRGNDTQILNALAWYAGEEVARAYCDLIDND